MRDRRIIQAVYTHRALTTPQIVMLLFPAKDGKRRHPNLSRARHRLKMLFQHGYLFRDEQPTQLTEGRKPLVYFLDKRAIPVLAQLYGVDPAAIDWKKRDNNVRWMFLDHLLATNDVRVAIECAAQANGFKIERWLDDKTLRRREMRDSVTIHGPEGGAVKVSIIPDGYFALTDGEYDYHHLLEVDMATETVFSSRFGRRDFSRKIQGYMAYAASGKYKERYGTDSMRVLTITTSRQRLRNLKVEAERVDGGSIFWFATFEDVSPSSVLTEPIWHVAGSDDRHKLIW